MCTVLLVSAFGAADVDATDIAFNLFKNRDVLATRTMPDLSALSTGHFGDHKNEYFGKLQTAWEQLNFDRSYISRGKRPGNERKCKQFCGKLTCFYVCTVGRISAMTQLAVKFSRTENRRRK